MSKLATSQVKLNANVTYAYTDPLGVVYAGNPVVSLTQTLSSSQITKVFSTSGTISSPTVFNFQSVVDAFGATLVFSTLKGLHIINNSTNQTLVIGGGSNPVLAGDQVTLGAGAMVSLVSPYTVSSGACILEISPSGSLAYQLVATGS